MPSRFRPAPLADPWPAPLAAGPVRATVTVPGSKSLTNRYLLLAALANGPSILRAPLASRDSALMVGALRTLGVEIEDDQEPNGADPEWRVQPPRRLAAGAGAVIDCGLAGTVMRFVPPIAALATGSVRFDGDEHARTRPVQPLLRALTDLGADVRDDGHGALPFTVHGSGTVNGGPVQIDSSASSQFVSALLLAGARFDRGVTVQHSGSHLPSTPHVQMTIAALAEAGVQVEARGRHTWHVAPQTVHPVDVVIEPDLSSAAAFLAAAAATGGSVAVRHWPSSSTQAGAQIVTLLQAMGARAVLCDGTLELTGPPRGELAGVDLDLHDVGELTPVVAALAALASGPSRLRGVAHLRGHETDRLQALETELSRLGGRVSQTEDGLRLEPATLHGGTVRTYGDHRMAMAGAVLGTVVPDVLIEDVGTAGKTVPDFAGRWAALIA